MYINVYIFLNWQFPPKNGNTCFFSFIIWDDTNSILKSSQKFCKFGFLQVEEKIDATLVSVQYEATEADLSLVKTGNTGKLLAWQCPKVKKKIHLPTPLKLTN